MWKISWAAAMYPRSRDVGSPLASLVFNLYWLSLRDLDLGFQSRPMNINRLGLMNPQKDPLASWSSELCVMILFLRETPDILVILLQCSFLQWDSWGSAVHEDWTYNPYQGFKTPFLRFGNQVFCGCLLLEEGLMGKPKSEVLWYAGNMVDSHSPHSWFQVDSVCLRSSEGQ